MLTQKLEVWPGTAVYADGPDTATFRAEVRSLITGVDHKTRTFEADNEKIGFDHISEYMRHHIAVGNLLRWTEWRVRRVDSSVYAAGVFTVEPAVSSVALRITLMPETALLNFPDLREMWCPHSLPPNVPACLQVPEGNVTAEQVRDILHEARGCHLLIRTALLVLIEQVEQHLGHEARELSAEIEEAIQDQSRLREIRTRSDVKIQEQGRFQTERKRGLVAVWGETTVSRVAESLMALCRDTSQSRLTAAGLNAQGAAVVAAYTARTAADGSRRYVPLDEQEATETLRKDKNLKRFSAFFRDFWREVLARVAVDLRLRPYVNEYGYDRTADCGCQWASQIQFDTCPEHGNVGRPFPRYVAEAFPE